MSWHGHMQQKRSAQRRSAATSLLWLLVSLLLGAVEVFSALPAQAQVGKVLRVAEDRLPRSFNPLFAETLVELRLTSLLSAGLYAEDRFQNLTPVLAESLVPDPEVPNAWRLTLKPRQRWHSQQLVTSEDVFLSIKTLQRLGASSPLGEAAQLIQQVEPLGPLSLRLTFVRPVREPGRLLTFPILPAGALKAAPMSPTHPYRMRPVGAGPFALDTVDTRGNLSLSRHVPYSLGIPELPAIQLLEIRDKQIQLESLRFGNLEVVVRVLPRDLPDLAHQRRLTLRPYQTNAWWYLGFNLNRGSWKSLAMRQAIAMLLDVDKLLEPIGGGERISGPFVPSSPYYNHAPQVSLQRHNPAEAVRKLAALGYVRSSQGQWEKDGQPLTLRLAVEKEQPLAREVAVSVEGQLKRAGLGVEVRWLDPAGWQSQVVQEKSFDLALSQWSFDRNEDIYEQYHSRGRLNYGGFAHAQVDALLERARVEVDPNGRRQANQEVHRLLAEQLPAVFLWTLTQYAAFSSEVEDVSIDPFTFYSQVHRWRLGARAERGRR
ncbi:MAG: ABC transporter substrate-binding protein [Myxococcota bacterium]